MKRKWMSALKSVSLVVALLSLLLSSWPSEAMAQESLPPQVTVTVSTEVPQPPKYWVVVRDETFGQYNERGQWVKMHVREYREPIPHPLENSACEIQSTSRIESWLCSYWQAGSIHTTAQVGGITEHLFTEYTKYHWLGAADGTAWYLDHTKVWWERTSTAWSLGQTRMWIANTNGSKDCSDNLKEYADYNDYFSPSWHTATQTYIYKYMTDGRGILATPKIHPRIHQIGSTPVEYYGGSYGTLSEHRHRFHLGGYEN